MRPWKVDEATWEQAAFGQPWSVPGAAGVTDRTRSPTAISLPVVPGEDAILDLTAVVQLWQQDPSSKHGLLVAARSATAQSLRIAGYEYILPGWRPRLEITVMGQRQ